MRITILLLTICIIATPLYSQELNQVDAQGMKQGLWSKKHEGTNSVFYKGQFKNDMRIGEWVYFYQDGKTKAIMQFSDQGKVSRTALFSESGKTMAYGKHVNEKKDSTWTYYYDDGNVSSRENWKMNMMHGVGESYFRDGGISATMDYKDGDRHGEYKEFHSKDVIKVQGQFLQDEYDGQMIFYYANGKKEIEGKYVNGLREGTWRYYNNDGSIHYQMVYRQGKVVKEKKETGLFQVFNPDNTLVSEYNYKNGLKDGEYTLYHQDATQEQVEMIDEKTGEMVTKLVTIGNKLKEEGAYKLDLKHGTTKHYSSIGKLIKTEKYVEGELQ